MDVELCPQPPPQAHGDQMKLGGAGFIAGKSEIRPCLTGLRARPRFPDRCGLCMPTRVWIAQGTTPTVTSGGSCVEWTGVMPAQDLRTLAVPRYPAPEAHVHLARAGWLGLRPRDGEPPVPQSVTTARHMHPQPPTLEVLVFRNQKPCLPCSPRQAGDHAVT